MDAVQTLKHVAHEFDQPVTPKAFSSHRVVTKPRNAPRNPPADKAFMLYVKADRRCADLDGDVSIKSRLGCLSLPRRVTCLEGLP